MFIWHKMMWRDLHPADVDVVLCDSVIYDQMTQCHESLKKLWLYIL